MNPHQVTRDFEGRICEYTGAPYAVAVNSCTMALLLAVAYHVRVLKSPATVKIPKRTYVSVPASIIHAGARPVFEDQDWEGVYELAPLRVFDSARWFTSNLYDVVTSKGRTTCDMVCVSFHASKTLGLEQGGAILHNSPEADPWLRAARFDGRTSGVAPINDTFSHGIGWHCYMNPSTAAQGILKLHSLPLHNAPLPNDDYPDLSTLGMFR